MKAATNCWEQISVEVLARASEVIHMLAHPDRLRLLAHLDRHGPTPVLELAKRIGLSQAATSQQLNLLRRTQILTARRRGRQVLYSIIDTKVPALLCCLLQQYAPSPPHPIRSVKK